MNLEFGWMVLGVSWYHTKSQEIENGAARLFLA